MYSFKKKSGYLVPAPAYIVQIGQEHISMISEIAGIASFYTTFIFWPIFYYANSK